MGNGDSFGEMNMDNVKGNTETDVRKPRGAKLTLRKTTLKNLKELTVRSGVKAGQRPIETVPADRC